MRDTYKLAQNARAKMGRPLGRVFKKILGAFPDAAKPS
jgi:hypothetical protein